jgi:hypothetical protein
VHEFQSPSRSDKTFFWHADRPKSWFNARETCITQGGDLATIADADENYHITTHIVAPAIWIGLNDISNEGSFVWADGGTSSYSDFGPSQPDNYLEKEHCIQIVDWTAAGLRVFWNDEDCTTTATFLCAKCGGSVCAVSAISELRQSAYICLYVCAWKPVPGAGEACASYISAVSEHPQIA